MSKERGAVPLLRNIDLAVRENQITALIGESGAGKTILARAVAALLPENIRIVNWSVFYRARAVDADWLRRARGREIFYAPQNAAGSFNPVIKIKKQIKEVSKIPPEQLVEILKFLNVDDPARLLNAYPFELSEGENQRALLALALSMKPEILILDEPTSALDSASQADFIKLINKAQLEFHLSILLITHNLDMVRNIADHIYIIFNGEIVDQGNPSLLFQNPNHPYTREIVDYLQELN